MSFKPQKITVTFNYKSTERNIPKDRLNFKGSSFIYKFKQSKNTARNFIILSNNNLNIAGGFQPETTMNLNYLQDEESIHSFNSSQITYEDEEENENKKNNNNDKNNDNQKIVKVNYFESMPEKIVINILNFMNKKEIKEISKINKSFKNLTKKYKE